MRELQRYKLGPIDRRGTGSIYCEMKRDDNGTWVRWEDVNESIRGAAIEISAVAHSVGEWSRLATEVRNDLLRLIG